MKKAMRNIEKWKKEMSKIIETKSSLKDLHGPEGIPPTLVGDEVVVTGGAKCVVVSQGVVGPPESRGHIVGEDHINGVVTSSQQQEDNSTEGG